MERSTNTKKEIKKKEKKNSLKNINENQINGLKKNNTNF